MFYPSYIDSIIGRLESEGEQAYIVGGSLRDIILGAVPHDYDITTSASPNKIIRVFSDKRVIETGIKHGTVTVLWDGEPVEITTFRVDGDYTDSRHPDSVNFTKDVKEDLARRDFTVNAMAYSGRDGLIDPFGGKADIIAKTIRAVGDAEKRFTEDALRIMRAFRFCAQLGFDIEPLTLKGIDATKQRLSLIARERIGAEFLRLICSENATKALRLMKERGIFPYVLGAHTPSEQSLLNVASLPPTAEARLALLLLGLEGDTARAVLRELRLSGKQITATLAILRGAYSVISAPEDARRLISVTGIYAAEAARLSELIGVSPQGAYELTLKQQNTPCSVKDLRINGKDLSELGMKGKQIGETLALLLERVIAEPKLNKEDILSDMATKIYNGEKEF